MKGGRVVGRAAGGGGGDSVVTSARQNIQQNLKSLKSYLAATAYVLEALQYYVVCLEWALSH